VDRGDLSPPGAYYPRFALPSWFAGPASLAELLADLWSYRYPDLYEAVDERPEGTVPAACGAVLDALGDPADPTAHRRYLFLGWSLGLAAAPTVDAWRPDDGRPRTVLDAVQRWLAGAPVRLDPALFPSAVTPPQALHEALDVFRNLALAVEPSGARAALLEILDDCLEGYAVFPGSDGRRDLFNWYLVEAVPAAWSQRPPDRVYTLRWPWPPLAE
jgi:hypothetical protein